MTPLDDAVTQFAYHQRRRAPFITDHNVPVVPVRCKTELGVSRRGAVVHRIDRVAAVAWRDRVQYAAVWLCGIGCKDITLLASADGHGGAICGRCKEGVAGIFVYRCYASDGRLLYIGCTCSYASRIATHRSQRGWWPEVANLTREPYQTVSGARAAERLAIQAEKPAYNRQWASA